MLARLWPLCLLVCAVVCAVAAVGAEMTSSAKPGEWPQWQGPDRNGLSPDKGLLQEWGADGPPLLWTAKGLGQGFAGISIQDGRIFTMGDREGKEVVIALDLNDGHELWATPIGDAAANNGYPGPRCTPTCDGQLIYAIGSKGDLAALEAKTGNVVWKKNFVSDFGGKMMSGWGYSESPLVDGDKVLCTPGGPDAMIVALNKKTGDEIWRSAMPAIGEAGKDGAAYSSIVISNAAGKKQYVQLVGRGVIGVSADDGKFLWGYNKVANGVANIPTPIIKDDFVFCSTSYDAGAALLKLVPEDGGVKAEEQYFMGPKDFQNHHGGMVMVGDYIYAGHGKNNGFPICIEWPTGKIVWGGKERGAGTGSAAVTYADGRLYFRYQDGTMALIGASPDSYQVYGTFKIPDVAKPSWPHPVIAGGKMYLREQDALLCYDVKAPSPSSGE